MEWWQPLNSQGFKELGIGTGETTSISPSEVFQNPSIQNFSIEKAIRSAFHFFKKNWIGCVSWMILAILFGLIPFLNILFLSLMATNLHICVKDFNDNGSAMSISRLLDFSNAFEKILAPIIIGFLICLGFVFLIVPGLILFCMWIFATCVLADKPEISIGLAMQESSRLTKGKWLKILLLITILWLLGASGFLLFGVGALVTVPVAHVALYYAYEQCRGTIR